MIIMSALHTHTDTELTPTNAVHSFVLSSNTPPILRALQERARWFHEHPTRSPLLMRLEADAHQRKLG